MSRRRRPIWVETMRPVVLAAPRRRAVVLAAPRRRAVVLAAPRGRAVVLAAPRGRAVVLAPPRAAAGTGVVDGRVIAVSLPLVLRVGSGAGEETVVVVGADTVVGVALASCG